MGLAQYQIVPQGDEWGILHDGDVKNTYATKEAAFEAAVARLAFAARLLADSRGRLPHFGDDDGGTLVPICGRAADDVRDNLLAHARFPETREMRGDTLWRIAGGFGNYLSVRSALRIGLIPPGLPESRIRYVGNAAALGAQLALVSEAERARAEAIARRIEHVSLAAHPDFETIFVDCMNFPRPLPLPSGERAG